MSIEAEALVDVEWAASQQADALAGGTDRSELLMLRSAAEESQTCPLSEDLPREPGNCKGTKSQFDGLLRQRNKPDNVTYTGEFLPVGAGAPAEADWQVEGEP